ncbi:MAG: DUF2934 domain-containing protein [Rhodopila sp.]
MTGPDQDPHQIIRETAYSIWEQEGRPDGHAEAHWHRAVAQVAAAQPRIRPRPRVDDDPTEDEERVLAGRPDVNFPALLTKDVHGG